MTGKERRRHPRFTVVAQVELDPAGDDVAMLKLINVSVGGALLKLSSSDAVEPGTELSTFLDFGSDTIGGNLAVTMQAEVLRTHEGEGQTRSVALKWIGGPTRELERILEQIETKSADAKVEIKA